MPSKIKQWLGLTDDTDDELDEFDEEIEEIKDEPTTEEIEAAKVILSAVETEDAEEEFTIPKVASPDNVCFVCQRAGLKGGNLNMLASSGHLVLFVCSECADKFKRG